MKTRKIHEKKYELIIVKNNITNRSKIEGFKPVVWFIKRRIIINHNKNSMIKGNISYHGNVIIKSITLASAAYSDWGYNSLFNAQERKVIIDKIKPKKIASNKLFNIKNWINEANINEKIVIDIINLFGK